MILYELRGPTEHKFGGSLSESERARCTKETELDSPRWEPYSAKPCVVENICGKFLLSSPSCPNCGTPGLERLQSVSFKVASPFGQQTEIYHIAGHVTYRATPGLPKSMIFKGVRGCAGLAGLKRGMMFDSVSAQVHMAVVGCCLGFRVQTTAGSYLENRVNGGVFASANGERWMRVENRSLDQCNVIRLSVIRWDHPALLPANFEPSSNDIVVTGKGSVLHRFTWGGLVWDEAAEAAVLLACERVAGAIRATGACAFGR